MTRESHSAIARRLHDYFCSHREEAMQSGRRNIAAVPDAESVHTMIDAAFWASLRREEGFVPKISLAFLSARQDCSPVVLDRPLPLAPEVLARVSPAVESPGIHLGVWRSEENLYAWGMTRKLPELCFVLEVAGPGLLVIKHPTADESDKYVNVAVLEGDQFKMIDANACGPASGFESLDTTVKLALAMRAHGRGGSLLVVPSSNLTWRESIVQPIVYGVSAPSCELAPLNDAVISAIAGLSAVDGAVVLTEDYELLGFGAKIVRRIKWPQVEQVTISEPVEGAVPVLAHPEQLGGTRHLSAAQFVHDQRDSAALVASQDGRFTIFEWSPREEMVHAYRLDALLL